MSSLLQYTPDARLASTASTALSICNDALVITHSTLYWHGPTELLCISASLRGFSRHNSHTVVHATCRSMHGTAIPKACSYGLTSWLPSIHNRSCGPSTSHQVSLARGDQQGSIMI